MKFEECNLKNGKMKFNIEQLRFLLGLGNHTSKFMKYGELQENLNVDMKNVTLKLNFEKKIEEYLKQKFEKFANLFKELEICGGRRPPKLACISP